MDVSAMLLDVPLWSVLSLLVLCLFYVYYRFYSSHLRTWENLGVPGPRPLPFLGNTHQLFLTKSFRLGCGIDKLAAQYGKIIGLYIFNVPALIVKDVDALKQIFVKDFNSFTDRWHPGEGGLLQKAINDGLAFQQGNAWRRTRKTVTPFFSIRKLKLLSSHLNTTARHLTQRLDGHARTGTMVPAKDVFAAFSFDAIVGTLFGLDLNVQNDSHSEMYRVVNRIFKVKPLVVLSFFISINFPWLRNLLRWLNIATVDNNCLEIFLNMTRKLALERKLNPQLFEHPDFLQLLLKAETSKTSTDLDISGDKMLTSEEVEGQMLVFMFAGYETTAVTLQYLVYSIAKDQNVQDKMLEEIARVVGNREDITYEMCRDLRYMEAVIQETVRMYPAVIALTRTCVKATTLNGYPVPVGTAIYTNAFNLGRDPDVYPDPNTFNPGRYYLNDVNNDDDDDDGGKTKNNNNINDNDDGDNELGETSQNKNNTTGACSSSSSNNGGQHTGPVGLFGFGLGPRHCVGMKLAVMELKIGLVHVLRTFRILGATPDVLELDDVNSALTATIPIQFRVARR